MSKSKIFITLGELLFNQNEDIATVGTAIEEHGIYAVNRDGGVKPYPIGSEKALQALSLLTACADAESHMRFKDFQAVGGSDYGWPTAVIPDFESIKLENGRIMRSLNDLLNGAKPVPYAGFACEIESNGVYGFDEGHNFRHFGPDSREAQEALTGISVHLKHETSPPPPEYEDWYMEQDPTYNYGWPKDEVPSFHQTEEYRWVESIHRLKSRGALFKKDIYTVGRLLLMHKAKPGSIKTAIERTGVYRLDGMGRVKPYAKEKDLGELDVVLERYAEVLMQGIEPESSLLEAPAYARFGWPKERLPDFAAIEAEPVPEPSMVASAPATASAVSVVPTAAPGRKVTLGDGDEGLSTRAKKPYELLILGLLCVLRGEFAGSKDPEFDTQNQESLAEFLTKHLGKHGAGVTSIKQKFSAANKLRSEVGLPALIMAKTLMPPVKS